MTYVLVSPLEPHLQNVLAIRAVQTLLKYDFLEQSFRCLLVERLGIKNHMTVT